jgi:hypothetical protein
MMPIPGIGCVPAAPGLSGGGGAECTFIGNAGSDANASVYTFTDQPVGDADPTRQVHVTITAGTTILRSVGAVDIGGETANIDVNDEVGTNRTQAIATRAHPLGTTATIEISLSGAAVNCEIGVYRGVNLSTGLIDAAADESTNEDANTTVNALEGGYVIAAAITWLSGGSPTISLVADESMTRNYHTLRETNWRHAGGLAAVSSDDPDFTVMADSSGSTREQGLAVASYR